MEISDLGVVISTRRLSVLGEEKREVLISIGKPQKLEDHTDYYCPYQIIGMGNDKIRCAFGIDGVQSLQLALSKIGADLYTSEESRIGKLRWVGDESGDLGFPVPDSIKDLLPNK